MVTVGRVTKAQGMKGEVRVSLSEDSVDAFARHGALTAVREGVSPRRLSLESVRTHGRTVVAKFAEVSDRASAESLTGWDLQVPEEAMPSLAEGEFYIFQLEGLEVVTDAGECLGTLVEVLDLPAHDVYLVRRGDREVMLPATEEVVREVDLENGRMVVHLLDGLLDEPPG